MFSVPHGHASRRSPVVGLRSIYARVCFTRAMTAYLIADDILRYIAPIPIEDTRCRHKQYSRYCDNVNTQLENLTSHASVSLSGTKHKLAIYS